MRQPVGGLRSSAGGLRAVARLPTHPRLLGLIITLATLTLGLLAAPLAAEAQQPAKVPRIGFLGTWPTNLHDEALRQGLHESGYAEGQNIAIERRYFEGRAERLPDLVTQLVRLEG